MFDDSCVFVEAEEILQVVDLCRGHCIHVHSLPMTVLLTLNECVLDVGQRDDL